MSMSVEPSRFLTTDMVRAVKEQFGTPTYVYSKEALLSQAQKALQFPNLFGLKVRFAMKACPNAAVLKIFSSMGICFDASSGFEVLRLVRAGITPTDISLSSQELPTNLKELIQLGIKFNACSIHQLTAYGRLYPGGTCGIRFNPGQGSGGTGKTNVGGPNASFGIWYELLPEVKAVIQDFNLNIERIHTHIGSGSDPNVWQKVSILSLNLVREFPSVISLNLGGGYKVGRMSSEVSTDLQLVAEPVKQAFKQFAEETGREIKLEIEPGTFLVANAGAMLATVQDIVSTGAEGHTFLKLDAGMTEVLRPSLYGAQHPIVVHNMSVTEGESIETKKYVVVGHCCESGDLFTCAPGDPEVLLERPLRIASIGDVVSVEGAGAYCASMSTKNYNSFPEAPEVMIDTDGTLKLIRRRQTLEQIIENELEMDV